MKQKIQALLNELNYGLVEREQTLKTALLTVLAGENLVLIGPPGTGKSLIARRIAESFSHENDNGYFEYLLTKFSTPEEIFGPLSISELKADRFKRNTAGYLPSVKIAFLDEIFKASSSILNALLTILNERLYHNGAEAQKVPLQALIAASNELPTDQEELNALYDRFLVRSFVDYVSEDNLLLLFADSENPDIQTPITADELVHIKNAVPAVTIPAEIVEAIQSIWIAHKETFKEDRRESLSDRRLKKVLHLLRVSAVTNGRKQLDLSDVFLLKDCLWNHQENALQVRELISKTLQRYSRFVPKTADTTSPQNTTTTAKTAQKTGQPNAKERGYKGLGTAEDPILIENVQDLMGLDHIGQKGYYFLQTADINCNAITTWPNINLQGHYNGGGYFIEYKNCYPLFQGIQAQSSVKNLELRNNLYLAENVADSTITDCLLVANITQGEYLGGIAKTLKSSTVERCLVTGKVASAYRIDGFSGITNTCNASTIRQCAIGRVELKELDWRNGRITGKTQNISMLENNISLDSNSATQNDERLDGKSISAALFNQRTFEHTLGWDFDNVWEWDTQKDHPVLRSVGVNAKTASSAKLAVARADTVDLLAQQIHANIWL